MVAITLKRLNASRDENKWIIRECKDPLWPSGEPKPREHSYTHNDTIKFYAKNFFFMANKKKASLLLET
jgi:hypothetical protein